MLEFKVEVVAIYLFDDYYMQASNMIKMEFVNSGGEMSQLVLSERDSHALLSNTTSLQTKAPRYCEIT